MNYCTDWLFINKMESNLNLSSLLALVALLLTFFAYRWSVIRHFNSWKSLFISLKNDLYCQQAWLSTSYPHYSYKEVYDPGKIIYPLSFTSLPQIIGKGVAELPNISNDFINNLSLFNERIIAFNSLLENVRQVITANPVLTQKMEEKLLDMGLDDRRISFEEFEISLKKLVEPNNSLENSEYREIYYLSKNIQALNKKIHAGLISTPEKLDGLNSLYLKINKETEEILKNFNKKIPFYIRISWLSPILIILLFLILASLI